MMKDGDSCATGSSCGMHPKAPLVVGALIILFTLFGMHGAVLFLWLDIILGAALVFLGVTGKCYLSQMMYKYCKGCGDKVVSTDGDKSL